MSDGQLNIFDALAALDPTLSFTMEAEPGWVWARCPVCAELRYIRRVGRTARTWACRLTPGCDGALEVYLAVDCEVCGKPVTARRRDADTRYCSKKCEAS